jgi:hypothetical protein
MSLVAFHPHLHQHIPMFVDSSMFVAILHSSGQFVVNHVVFFHMWSPPVISLLVILISTINPSYIGYSDITGHQLELVSVHKNDKFSVKSPLILAHQFHHVGSCRILSNGKGTFQEAQYLI